MYRRFIKREGWVNGGEGTDINKENEGFKGLGEWTGWTGYIAYACYLYI